MRKLLVILLLLTLLLPAACAEEMTLRVPNAVDLYFPEEEGGAQWTCALDDPEVVSVADQLFAPGELGDGWEGGVHWFHITSIGLGTASVTFSRALPGQDPDLRLLYRLSVLPGLDVVIWGVEMY